MPSGKFHVFIASLTVALALAALQRYAPFEALHILESSWFIILGLIPVVWIYAQFPDIDADASTINKWFNLLMVAIATYGIVKHEWIIAIPALLSILFVGFLKHRGITHTSTAAVILSLLLIKISWLWVISGFIAFTTHILLDGIPRRRGKK